MARCSAVSIEPSPIYEGTEHGLVLVRHQDAWRRVVAVCNQPGDRRIFLEVARIRQRREQNEYMDICEIVGRNALMSNGAAPISRLLSDTSLQVVPSTSCKGVGKLRWTTVAYRPPKPWKQYRCFPETVLIGSYIETGLSS